MGTVFNTLCIFVFLQIDRIRYIISSYLRVRLEKIERYAHYLLEKEASITDETLAALSPQEAIYAKEYVATSCIIFMTTGSKIT